MLEVLGGRGPDVRSCRSCARGSLSREPFLSPDLPRICAARLLLDFASHPASFGPCHAAFFMLFLKPVLFYDLAFPCSREGMEGVVGLQPFSAELLGLFFLSSAVGSCSDARMGWEVFSGFPGDSAGKESACNAGDLDLIPGLGRSPGEENSYPLQYSDLENSKDTGAWQATVHGVAKSWT